MKIAIVQLGSYGDNLNSTLMFDPLKRHFPQATLHLHTTDLYGSAFHNNPFVDSIQQHHAGNKTETFDLYNVVPNQVRGMGYDKVLVPHPVLRPGDWSSLRHPELGYNLILAFVRALEDEGVPYELPLRTQLFLDKREVERANYFLGGLPQGRTNILMEVSGESGQTFWSPDWTVEVGSYLVGGRATNLLVSRRDFGPDIQELQARFPGQVWWLGHLSIRECAEVFNHCQAFFSVSSGLSNACNSEHCRKDVAWIETINSTACNSAPIRSTGKIFWYTDDRQAFLEMLRSKGL